MKIQESKQNIAILKNTVAELRKQIKVMGAAQDSTLKDLRAVERISGAARAKVDEQHKGTMLELAILRQKYARIMDVVMAWLDEEAAVAKPERAVVEVAMSEFAAKKLSIKKAKILNKAVAQVNEYVAENNIDIDGSTLDGDEN